MNKLNLSSKKRNFLLIIVCFLVYLCTYFLKYSYNCNIINFESKYHVLHSETGLVSTMFFISYGIGQVVNGIFVKKYKLKYFIPGAVIISCILNVLVVTTPVGYFNLIKYYWLFNGIVLSSLWPCIIRFLTENISDEYRNKAIVTIGAVTAVGTALTYGFSSLFTKVNFFELIFVFGIVLGVLFAISFLLLYKSIINSDIITTKENKPLSSDEEQIKTKPNNNITPSFIIFITISILISMTGCFVREGFQTWCPTVLKELFSFSDSSSMVLTITLPIAQFFGVIVAVQVNKIIKNHILLCSFFIVLAILSLTIAWIFNFNEKVSLIIGMILAMVCSSSMVNVVCSIIPMSFGKSRNSGFYAGLFSGCSYAGSAAASYGLGAIADKTSWNNVFAVLCYSLIGILTLSVLVYFLYTFVKRKEER